MKTRSFSFLLLPALLVFTGCKQRPAPEQPATTATPASDRPAASANTLSTPPPFAGGRKTTFQDVTAQLDPGGSVFMYLATDQWLAGLSTNISQLRQILLSLPGAGADEREKLSGAIDIFQRLVRQSGVEDVTGVGLSGAPVAPGLNRNKFILHHAPGAGQGFLWSLFGRSPHALTGLQMLPANTALAGFADLDLGQFWQVLERELTQSGIPEAAEAARAFPRLFEQQTQIPWKPLLASLAGEIGFVFALDPTNTISIPAGGNAIALPAPGLLVAIKVNSDFLYDRISDRLQKANPNTTTSQEPGLKLCSMPLPLPLPIALAPTVASSGDYFFFGTSPELVRSVQAVRQGKQPGLKSSAQFQALAKHLPAEGNQFMYVAPSFGQTLNDLRRQALGNSGMQGEPVALLQRLLAGGEPFYSLAIGAHTATGWQRTSVGNQDSASAVLLAPAVAVTAVGAGLILPALAKAKSKAQTINSVNQLKQLGLAARMYANDHNEKFPNAQTWCDDLKPFLNGTKMFKAPNDPRPGACSYAFNEKLSGKEEGKINPQTVLFFEADADWNGSGGQELLLPRPRSAGVYVIGFADGSVQQIQAGRLGSLRWEP